MSEDIVQKMNQASLAENHLQLKARIEELEAERDEAWRRAAYAEEQWGRCEAKLAKAVKDFKDMEDCFKNWFDTKKLAEAHIDPKIVDAAEGYLRVSRVGGMNQDESDLVIGVIHDMAFRGVFSSIFTQFTLAELKGEK